MLDIILSDPAVIAGIFTIIGGIALKMVEKWLSKSTAKINQRKDYREEIKELSERLDKEEADVSLWRKKFFESEEQNHKLRMTMIEKGWEELQRRPDTDTESLTD